jgi:hypothetical protein
LFFNAENHSRQKQSATKEEAPMNTIATTETVNPSTQNPKQPQQKQTAAEAIAANVKALIEQLEAGTLGRPHRLPHGDGTLSQLQLRQHP